MAAASSADPHVTWTSTGPTVSASSSGGRQRRPSRLVVDLDDALDLHRHAVVELLHPDGGPGRPAPLAPQRDEEVRGAVDDLGELHELLGAGDHAEHLHDAPDPGQIAELGLDRGQHVERREPGRVVAVLLRELASDPADVAMAALPQRRMAGQVQEVAVADRQRVVGQRGWRLG